MPKKGKKAKGAKGAKGGKGKKGGKKGKKEGKKAKKESVLKDAMANAKLWETKLEAVEKSRQEYRENAKHLLYENDILQMQMASTEKDTLDVISYLKQEDSKKDDQVSKLQQALKEVKREARKERQALVDEYSQQIHQLQESLAEKTNEVKLMQSELKLVKEFRRKRAQMQRELDEIKESMSATERHHKDTLQQMEHKFFEEKVRLQQEASKKIAELAERAHSEAISNLDETTRSVYKENVRLNAALDFHIREGQELKKEKQALSTKTSSLLSEKELNGMIVQEKVVESKQQKKEIEELQEKVKTLEKSLSHVVREFEAERASLVQKSEYETRSCRAEISRLQRIVELKTKEMNRVKRLAKTILDQRTEVEQFFLDSLEYVKNEIIRNRIQYRKDAQNAYQQRMLEAHAGHSDFPRVRTFRQMDSSTNNVFDDLKEAERWTGVQGKVDMSELTWEQRERILRMLFAKMNGFKEKRRLKAPALEPTPPDSHSKALPSERTQEALGDSTFLTQQDVGGPSLTAALPLPPVTGTQTSTAGTVS
ncbi:basal body-orientation factor 1-like [Stylophora pistillata]|uniref:Basal body-orientation factor 1 n=1 Tax=Stylophora pistillata TaxID=50429 RepID=A0A2B4RQ31_STYPI|nr:basal body-orientation factor 1-like [Stylophora pistillata]PFX18447.1 Basal body-orientation factor 1 [Stylophora pistillata]